MAASLRSTAASSTSIPSVYSYNAVSDTITNTGLIIAGNNANGTKGVSNTTLTGRQWGIGPRVGAAWQPGMFHSKVVVRTGGGMYYDRGELSPTSRPATPSAPSPAAPSASTSNCRS